MKNNIESTTPAATPTKPKAASKKTIVIRSPTTRSKNATKQIVEQVKPKPASTKKTTKKQPPAEQFYCYLFYSLSSNIYDFLISEEEIDEETEEQEEPVEKRSKEKHDKLKPKPASTKKTTKKQPPAEQVKPKPASTNKTTKKQPPAEQVKPKPASTKKTKKKQPLAEQEEEFDEETEEQEEPVEKRSKEKHDKGIIYSFVVITKYSYIYDYII
ncbi:hypothetical protein LXL04_011734 [Taraxacum kok-saghyz]